MAAASQRFSVGFHSPLPPAATGVADYSAALLGELRKLGDVRVAQPDGAPTDVELYHLGNNSLHREIHAKALARPGVVVVHDATLNHFHLGSLSEREYVEEFAYCHGDEALGRRLWAERAKSGADARYFEYGMLRRVCERALAVIVHNPAAAAIVRAQAPRARIVEIPHLTTITSRHREGAVSSDPKELRVGVFGYLRESKRLLPILRVLDKLWTDDVPIRLTLQGSFGSLDLERAVEPWLTHPRITRFGHLPEAEFLECARSVDVCLNLRYPSAAETSGIAIALMALGKAVVFTEGAETARYPEGSCLRVPASPDEEPRLEGLLRWLAATPDVPREIGCRAAAHIVEHHDPARVARLYWDVLADACSARPKP